MSDVMTIILAAGKGTRMKSGYPKVLHEVCGYPMLYHVMKAVKDAYFEQVWIVIGYKGKVVRETIEALGVKAGYVEQKEQLGTGHAVKTALATIERKEKRTLILYGDTPLLKRETLQELVEAHVSSRNVLSILTATLENPMGYGRIVRGKNNEVVEIVEEKDASAEQKKIKEINTGIYCVETEWLQEAVNVISSDNAQGEFYLTDIVSIIHDKGGQIGGIEVQDLSEIKGVNDRIDLAKAHDIMKMRILSRLMQNGVTVYHPRSIYVELDVSIDQDCVVYPNCSFIGRVDIAADCVIGSGAFLKNVTVGKKSRIGAGSYLENTNIPCGAIIPPFSILKG